MEQYLFWSGLQLINTSFKLFRSLSKSFSHRGPKTTSFWGTDYLQQGSSYYFTQNSKLLLMLFLSIYFKHWSFFKELIRKLHLLPRHWQVIGRELLIMSLESEYRIQQLFFCSLCTQPKCLIIFLLGFSMRLFPSLSLKKNFFLYGRKMYFKISWVKNVNSWLKSKIKTDSLMGEIPGQHYISHAASLNLLLAALVPNFIV